MFDTQGISALSPSHVATPLYTLCDFRYSFAHASCTVNYPFTANSDQHSPANIIKKLKLR